MSVVIETTLGDITVDLYTNDRPRACLNFLKLCKIKYYNYNLFHTISRGFIAQTGDPTGSRSGGDSIYGILDGPKKRFFEGENEPRIKHTKMGLISFVGNDERMIGSQFFLTLGEDLTYLDEKHCVFGEVVEGFDILEIINEVICDNDDRPYQDVRITHTVIVDDPFPDPKRLSLPSRSPSPNAERLKGGRIAPDEEINEMEGKAPAEVAEMQADREAKARATILEMVGDLPDADMAPPENVLFVCKLNPVTSDDDLEIIFSRFGKIKSCEVIRDKKTGDSLQYAFVEFEDKNACETAYFKMDNVLIDDRRIHVDFSQSVSKVKWRGKGRGVTHYDEKGRKVNKEGDRDIGKGNYKYRRNDSRAENESREINGKYNKSSTRNQRERSFSPRRNNSRYNRDYSKGWRSNRDNLKRSKTPERRTRTSKSPVTNKNYIKSSDKERYHSRTRRDRSRSRTPVRRNNNASKGNSVKNLSRNREKSVSPKRKRDNPPVSQRDRGDKTQDRSKSPKRNKDNRTHRYEKTETKKAIASSSRRKSNSSDSSEKEEKSAEKHKKRTVSREKPLSSKNKSKHSTERPVSKGRNGKDSDSDSRPKKKIKKKKKSSSSSSSEDSESDSEPKKKKKKKRTDHSSTEDSDSDGKRKSKKKKSKPESSDSSSDSDYVKKKSRKKKSSKKAKRDSSSDSDSNKKKRKRRKNDSDSD